MKIRVAAPVLLILAFGVAPAADKKPALPGIKSKLPAEPGYERRVIDGFEVLINKSILDKPFDEFAKPPYQVLDEELKAIGKLIIPKILKELQRVSIWVEWDEGMAKANGSRTIAVYHGGSWLAYQRAESPIDRKKGNQVEVLTLKFLTELKQPGRDQQQVVLLHELVHAVHDKVLGRENPEILAAYRQAKDRKLYENVEHRNGPRRDGYANTNAAEYFAEISCMFLDKVDYFPYDKEGLKAHDPEGYKVAEKVWGKVVAKPKAEAKAIAAGPRHEPKPPAKVDPEIAAAGKLDLIRELVKVGKKEKARQRLKELIKTYPDTKAAGEAARLLEELK